MTHTRYEINFHERRVTTLENGIPTRETSFAEALRYQRNIVTMLINALHRTGFTRLDPLESDDRTWVYEGWAA